MLIRGVNDMIIDRLICIREKQSAFVKFMSAAYRCILCIICIIVVIVPLHSNDTRKVRGELSVLCEAVGSDEVCCDSIKKDLGSIKGVAIISTEGIPKRILAINIDRNRLKMFDVEIGMILSSLESIPSVKIIKYEADAILVEGTNDTSILDIAHCKIKSFYGDPVYVLDFASVKLINAQIRRPYAAGDRRVILTIEMESDVYSSFNNLIQKKYLNKPGISWKILTDAAR
jgi:hypothetical protein